MHRMRLTLARPFSTHAGAKNGIGFLPFPAERLQQTSAAILDSKNPKRGVSARPLGAQGVRIGTQNKDALPL